MGDNKMRKGFTTMLVIVLCCLLLAPKSAESATKGRSDGGINADGDGSAAEGGGEGGREGGGGGGGGGREGGGNGNTQPHIVLIVADDLGWNDVPWNNKEVIAPHMQALAQEGIILEQSYVQPICTPTRSALMGGRYPFAVGRQHGVIRPAMPTGLDLSLTLLPEVMKMQGYTTHAVGKWHLGFCSWPYTPLERGFDSFYGYYTGSEDYFDHVRDWSIRGEEEGVNNDTTITQEPCNDLYCDDPFVQQPSQETEKVPYLDLRDNTTPDWSQDDVYSAPLFASQVETLLATRDPQVPMFLYLPFQSVHAPLQVPDSYVKPYAHIHDQKRRTYLGMVSAMDEAIERVVIALKNTSHYNNTIIIFTTDNGGPVSHGANNWPLRGSKATLWEGGTRGAAFVHSPLLPNPATSNPTLIHVTDWFPTLVGLAGGAAPEGGDGVDQWAAITGGAPTSRSHLVYNIDNTTDFRAGIRMGKYKLLVGNPGPGNWTPPPENTPPTYNTSPSPSSTPILLSSLQPDEDDVTERRTVGDTSTTTTTPTTAAATTPATTTVAATTAAATTTATATMDGEELNVVGVMDEEEEKEEEEEEEVEKVVPTEEERVVEGSFFGGEISRLLQEMSGKDDIEIRLYDLDSDPIEAHNLATTNIPVVKVMVLLLHQHLPRYTPADFPPETHRAHPKHWGNVWSPGWC